MNKALLLALCFAAVSSTTIPSWVYGAFSIWCVDNNKTYDSPSEREYRVGVYYTNMMTVHNHNALNLSYTLETNQFADLTTSEFLEMYTGLNINQNVNATKRYASVAVNTSVPTSVDWVTAGAVTGVKNQGQCGDCWAFSTTGGLEGVYEIATGTLTSFSEQQLTDCSDSYGNEGCNGGLMDDAFKYVEAEGIETEANYPFKGVDQKCKYSASDVVFKISGYTDVTPSDNDALQAAVALQPISIGIDAESIMLYSSGIFDNKNCGTELDHGVLIAGYGEANGTPYWLVKNSWGASWGEEGYIRFIRASGQGTAICGLNLQASYPQYTA